MNKQQLVAKIWETANQMRSKIEANKYLSDQLVQFVSAQGLTGEDDVTMPPFKLNMRIDKFLQTFIFSQADDLLANATADLGDEGAPLIL